MHDAGCLEALYQANIANGGSQCHMASVPSSMLPQQEAVACRPGSLPTLR
jgi:hypothetical protein